MAPSAQPDWVSRLLEFRDAFVRADEAYPPVSARFVLCDFPGGWKQHSDAHWKEHEEADARREDVSTAGDWRSVDESQRGYFVYSGDVRAVGEFEGLARLAGAVLPPEIQLWPPIPRKLAGGHFLPSLERHKPDNVGSWLSFLFHSLSQVHEQEFGVITFPFAMRSWGVQMAYRLFPASLMAIDLIVSSQRAKIARAGLPTDDDRPTAADDPSDPIPPQIECHVMLVQMAAIVNRGKRTLERLRNNGKLPAPAVKGGKGKADEWLWSEVRPILETEYNRQLPEAFPADRFQRR